MAISLRKAINEKCKSCTYDPLSGHGTWREQTEGCTVKVCPLWDVRPMSQKRPAEGQKKPMPAQLASYLAKKKLSRLEAASVG